MSASEADSDRLGDRRRWLIEPCAVEVLINIRPDPSPRLRYGPDDDCAAEPSVCERCLRTVAGSRSFGSSGNGPLRSVTEVDPVGNDEMVLTPEMGRDAIAVEPDSLLSARARNVRLRSSSESSPSTASDSAPRGVGVSNDGRGPLTTIVCVVSPSLSDGGAGGGLDGDGGDRRRGDADSSMPLYASSGQSVPNSVAVTSGAECELAVDGREMDAANESGMPCRCRGDDAAEDDDDDSVLMKLVSGALSTDLAIGGDDGLRRLAVGGVNGRRSSGPDSSSRATPPSSIMLPTRSRSVDRRRTRGGRGRSRTGLAWVDESVEAGWDEVDDESDGAGASGRMLPLASTRPSCIATSIRMRSSYVLCWCSVSSDHAPTRTHDDSQSAALLQP